MKNQLNQFDPRKVAEMETAMWRAYYQKKFYKLPTLMVGAMRELYGLKGLDAYRAAYHFSIATVRFGLTRGKENETLIAERLTKGMVYVCGHAGWRFDHVQAARREAHWWLVDRYPERFRTPRWEGIARSAAVIYGASPDSLSEYADLRAKAMVYHDDVEAGRKKENWKYINTVLEDSYRSLKAAVA
jgi:hypothetical protein